MGENHLLARMELYAWWRTRAVEVLWDLLLPAASGALLLYGGTCASSTAGSRWAT